MVKSAAKEWLTINDVASEVGRPQSTVYAWVYSGLLKARDCSRVGSKRRSYRVSRNDLRDLQERMLSGLPAGA